MEIENLNQMICKQLPAIRDISAGVQERGSRRQKKDNMRARTIIVRSYILYWLLFWCWVCVSRRGIREI